MSEGHWYLIIVLIYNSYRARMDIRYSKYYIFTESQVHKLRLSTARYYESETQIQNGVNTSTVILLKTKCLVRLTFRQLFLGGGYY